MNLWQEYKRPKSVEQAIKDLTTSSGSSIPLAGGTDLLLDLKQGRHLPVDTIVDLTFIPELTLIELRENELYIGAAVPLNHIAQHPLAGKHAQALVEACNLIAGPQVRNVATLGGNVAHALPAADGTIALSALGASVAIASVSGITRVPIPLLFQGPGKSALVKGSEIIVGFYIPTLTSFKKSKEAVLNETGSERSLQNGSCFKRIMRPQGVALPILNCAAWLVREIDMIKAIHIAIGPGGGTPFRAALAEDFLCDQPLTELTFSRSLELILEQVQFRSSARRASADYRRQIIGDLFKDVLFTAWNRAK